MTQQRASLTAAYFDEIYAKDPDPWRFQTSAYEAEKYATTLACLSRDRYNEALEVGCSIGVFTRRLAERCDALLSIDVSEQALAAARRECLHIPHIEFRHAGVPAEFPTGSYDLIVLSEVLYYLSVDDLQRVANLALSALRPSGEVVLCHWLGETDYPLSGDEAANLFIAATITQWPAHLAIRRPSYRLDRLSSKDAGSVVGERTGSGRLS